MSETDQPVAEQTSSEWRGWLLPVGVAVGIVVLVVIALTRGPAEFDPSTPEYAVQTYLQAIADERWEDAYSVVDPEAFPGCDAVDISNSNPGQFTAVIGGEPGDGGFVRGESEPFPTDGSVPEPDETVIVDVIIRHGNTGIFGGGWEEWATFSVVSRDGFWWIGQESSPWPYWQWNCQEFAG